MRKFDDVFLCAAWYQDCTIDWNALEAIGTIGAVIVVLVVWILDRKRLKDAEDARKIAAALILLPIVREWLRRINQTIDRASRSDVVPDSRSRVVAFSGSIAPPAEFETELPRLADLGEVGVSLGHRMMAVAEIDGIREALSRDANCLGNPTESEHEQRYTSRAMGWIELVTKQSATLRIIESELKSIANGRIS